MRLDPLHPAAWILDLLTADGWNVRDLLSFTRSSTLILAHRGVETPVVVKVGFGSNHVLHQMAAEHRSAAYGFYWYIQLTDAERALSRDDFLHERDLARSASHLAGVVPVVEHGELGDLPWYAMAWCDGGNFRPYLTHPKLQAQGLRVLGDIARGLDTLHQAGIVHRDVYQENVLIHEGRGLLTDLGAARRIDSPRGPQHRAPEPHWPPEYSTDYAKATPAADVFSLAVLIFRLVIGDLPRLGSRQDLAQLPRPLRDLVANALHHSPTMRPTASELASALYEAAAAAGRRS